MRLQVHLTTFGNATFLRIIAECNGSTCCAHEEAATYLDCYTSDICELYAKYPLDLFRVIAAMSKITAVASSSQMSKVLSSNTCVIVDFWATW
jgi:hypothetical protein